MKLLICKDTLTNRIIETKALQETETIIYEVIDNAPIIEERENEIGHYEIGENGELTVIYKEKPKSQLDLIQEQLNQLTNYISEYKTTLEVTK